jgi:hypothetical protein
MFHQFKRASIQMKAPATQRRTRQQGNTVLEFALSSLFLIPLTLGSFVLGMALTKFLQVTAVARDTGSMFVRGVDFSQTSYQKVIGRIAYGMGMTDANGNIVTDATGRGVVIISQVMRIGEADCAGGGFVAPNYTGCANKWKAVITKRVVVGNSQLRSSSYGTPRSGIINQSGDTDGSIRANYYLTEASVVVAALGMLTSETAPAPAPLELSPGQNTFLAEAYFIAPELNLFPSFLQVQGYYAYNFF